MEYFESLTIANYHAAKTDAERNFMLKLLRMQQYHDVALLLESQIHPYENLESIIFKAASKNALSSITPLLRALGMPDRGILNPKRHVQLCNSLKVNNISLSLAIPTKPAEICPEETVYFGGHRLRANQLALSTSRFCPLCISEGGYGRTWWSLLPQGACEEHGMALIDHCPECKSPISIARPAYNMCGCGHSLSGKSSACVSEQARFTTQIIGAHFRRNFSSLKSNDFRYPMQYLNKLDLSMTIDLVSFMGNLNLDPKIARLKKLRSPTSLNLVVNNLERASRSLSDWPNGFYAELRNARAFFPSTESVALVAKSLDHVIQLATISMPQPELRFVAEEIGRFLARPNEWNSARKQYSLQNSDNHAHITSANRSARR